MMIVSLHYRTSYGQMNDWMRMARDTDRAGGVPLTVTDSNWRGMKKVNTLILVK